MLTNMEDMCLKDNADEVGEQHIENKNIKEHIRSSQDSIKGDDSFNLKVLKTMALYLSFVGMASIFPCIYHYHSFFSHF